LTQKINLVSRRGHQFLKKPAYATVYGFRPWIFHSPDRPHVSIACFLYLDRNERTGRRNRSLIGL